MPFSYELSEEQKRMLMAPPMAANGNAAGAFNPNAAVNAFNSEGSTPISGFNPNTGVIPPIATQQPQGGGGYIAPQ
jgi:hypothetical protein